MKRLVPLRDHCQEAPDSSDGMAMRPLRFSSNDLEDGNLLGPHTQFKRQVQISGLSSQLTPMKLLLVKLVCKPQAPRCTENDAR
jgi:hypothetical protein